MTRLYEKQLVILAAVTLASIIYWLIASDSQLPYTASDQIGKVTTTASVEPIPR